MVRNNLGQLVNIVTLFNLALKGIQILCEHQLDVMTMSSLYELTHNGNRTPIILSSYWYC